MSSPCSALLPTSARVAAQGTPAPDLCRSRANPHPSPLPAHSDERCFITLVPPPLAQPKEGVSAVGKGHIPHVVVACCDQSPPLSLRSAEADGFTIDVPTLRHGPAPLESGPESIHQRPPPIAPHPRPFFSSLGPFFLQPQNDAWCFMLSLSLLVLLNFLSWLILGIAIRRFAASTEATAPAGARGKQQHWPISSALSAPTKGPSWARPCQLPQHTRPHQTRTANRPSTCAALHCGTALAPNPPPPPRTTTPTTTTSTSFTSTCADFRIHLSLSAAFAVGQPSFLHGQGVRPLITHAWKAVLNFHFAGSPRLRSCYLPLHSSHISPSRHIWPDLIEFRPGPLLTGLFLSSRPRLDRGWSGRPLGFLSGRTDWDPRPRRDDFSAPAS